MKTNTKSLQTFIAIIVIGLSNTAYAATNCGCPKGSGRVMFNFCSDKNSTCGARQCIVINGGDGKKDTALKAEYSKLITELNKLCDDEATDEECKAANVAFKNFKKLNGIAQRYCETYETAGTSFETDQITSFVTSLSAEEVSAFASAINTPGTITTPGR